MNRTLVPLLRFVLVPALAVLAAGGGAAWWASTSPAVAAAGSGGETPLPAGWELCILQGVSAPASQANVANLDEWQAAEGGSTNNTAAFNPFNTARTTDVNNNPLPETSSANSFPAFNNWLAGCAATVATILQPNMSTIAAGLRAGNVTPSSAFLAVVDQSQWCAPSADGTPCYANQILGTTGNLANAVLSASSALDVFGNVRSDLRSYQLAVAAVASAQQTVLTTNQQLSAAQTSLTTAEAHASHAVAALRRFAVGEYESSGLYQTSTVVAGTSNGPFGTPSQQGVVVHEYAATVASDLLARSQQATAAAKAALASRNGDQKTLQQAVDILTSDTTTKNRSLVRLVADVSTLQTAGACTTATITEPIPAPSAAPDSSATPSTSTSTTTTTVPPTTTTSSTTTTTTTTTPTTPTTPTTLPSLDLSGIPTTTTTVPPTTTTSSTTTTTVPDASSNGSAAAPPPTPNPAGIQNLQGCVTSLAPTGTT